MIGDIRVERLFKHGCGAPWGFGQCRCDPIADTLEIRSLSHCCEQRPSIDLDRISGQNDSFRGQLNGWEGAHFDVG